MYQSCISLRYRKKKNELCNYWSPAQCPFCLIRNTSFCYWKDTQRATFWLRMQRRKQFSAVIFENIKSLTDTFENLLCPHLCMQGLRERNNKGSGTFQTASINRACSCLLLISLKVVQLSGQRWEKQESYLCKIYGLKLKINPFLPFPRNPFLLLFVCSGFYQSLFHAGESCLCDSWFHLSILGENKS